MKILMSYNDWSANADRKRLNEYGGIGYYRIVKPSQNIKGHDVKLVGRELMNYGQRNGEAWDNIFKENDIFWTHYFKEDKNAASMFYMRDKYKRKVVIDLDDNFWDVPESNPLYENYKSGKGDRAFLSTILYFADVIVTSTEPLKERIIKHFKDVDGTVKKVFVVPNMNDERDWDVPRVQPDKDIFRIGYSGSNSHFDDLRMVLPSIVNIMKKYPHVQLEIIGAVGKGDIDKYFHDIPQDIRNRIGLLPVTATFKEYPEWLSKQKWNVGICPLVDTPFTRSKSHIKFLEYSSVGIPTIASRVYPYFMDIGSRPVITDGETGLLVKQNEWERAIEDLILHEDKRVMLADNAYNFVKKTWQYDISGVMNEIIEALK